MSEKATIYHNPRCSKSRATLDILESHGEPYDIVKYLDVPPAKETLINILSLLELTPRELMRKTESEYVDNNLADQSLSDDELIDAMLKYPKLIERPIVVKNGRAAIGRPPESVLNIL